MRTFLFKNRSAGSVTIKIVRARDLEEAVEFANFVTRYDVVELPGDFATHPSSCVDAVGGARVVVEGPSMLWEYRHRLHPEE